MGSKMIVFLGFCLAMVLLISSQVVATETSDTVETSSTEVDETNGAAINNAKYGGYGGGGGGGGGYGHGGGGGGGRYGGKCRYGCCGRNYGGGCKCCSYAGEKVNVEPQAKPQN